MIAADSSSLRRYYDGHRDPSTERVAQALLSRELILPPVVVCEALSDPDVPAEFSAHVVGYPRLALLPGFWERAGRLRGETQRVERKAKLGDALIAQCCIDHGVALITYDRDFRHFERAGLRLA